MKKILLVLFVIIVASITLIACGGEDSTTTIPTESSTTATPSKDSTTAHPTQSTVTVTFDSAGGSSVPSQYVKNGGKVEKPENPTKEGYIFDGWYVEDAQWDFDASTVSENITLVAKWTLNTYTITYVTDENVSNLSNPTSCTANDIISLKTPTSNNRYTVFCWYTDSNYINEITEIKNVEKNITLYGKWVTSDNAITFEKVKNNYQVKDCLNIEKVVIPASYNGLPVTSIGNNAFDNCSALTSVTIPNGVKVIREYAFRNCSSLKSITIPNSVTSISNHAFEDCTALTNITIPDSVTSIGAYAFRNCSSLTSIKIPNKVTAISEGAFVGCLSLKSVTIPNSVEYICNNAFESCFALTSITIPNSVTSIGDNAFIWCSSLKSITIPKSVTSIGTYAFFGCYSLTSVVIPDITFFMGDSAFLNCISATIYCTAENQPSNWSPNWNPDNRPVVWGYTG